MNALVGDARAAGGIRRGRNGLGAHDSVCHKSFEAQFANMLADRLRLLEPVAYAKYLLAFFGDAGVGGHPVAGDEAHLAIEAHDEFGDGIEHVIRSRNFGFEDMGNIPDYVSDGGAEIGPGLRVQRGRK